MKQLRTLYFALLALFFALPMSMVAQDEVSVMLRPNPAEGGTIRVVDGTGKSYANDDMIKPGTEVDVTITPNEGYKIVSVTNNDSQEYGTGTGSKPLSEIMGSDGVVRYKDRASERRLRVAVEFERATPAIPTKYTVTINQPPTEKGSITVKHFYMHTPIASGDKVDPNEEISVSAREEEGHTIKALHIGDQVIPRDELEMDYGSTKNVHYTVTSDVTISLEFEEGATPTPMPKHKVSLSIYPGDGTISCIDSEGVSYKDGDLVEEGKSITLTLTPAAKQRINEITLNGKSYKESDGSLQAVLTDGRVATFQFVVDSKGIKLWASIIADKRTITIETPDPSQGTITVKDTEYGWALNSGTKVDGGSEIVVEATELAGYQLTTLHIGNRSLKREELGIQDGKTKEIRHTVSADITVRAEYQTVAPASFALTITTPDATEGTLKVTKEGEISELTNGAKVDKDTKVVITATPASGYKVQGILVNGIAHIASTLQDASNNAKSLTIAVTAETTIQAKFEKEAKLAPVQLVHIPFKGGSISCVDQDGKEYSRGSQIEVGKKVTIKMTPKTNYRVSSFLLNGKTYKDTNNTIDPYLDEQGVATIEHTVDDRGIDLMVSFKDSRMTISITRPSDEEGTIVVTNATTNEAIYSGSRVAMGTEILVKATEKEGYQIKTLEIGDQSYSRELLDVIDGATKEIRHKVAKHITIKATYEALKELVAITWKTPLASEGTLKVTKEGDSAELASGSTVEKGCKVTITATPSEGYQVENIVVGAKTYAKEELTNGEANAKSLTVTIDEATSISVKFAKSAELVYVFLSPNPAEGGTIKVVGKDGTIYGDYPQQIAVGTEVDVTITPNKNYAIDYIDVNGEEYGQGHKELSQLVGADGIAKFSTKAGEKKLRIACEFRYTATTEKYTISIEQPSDDKGRIEVEELYTRQPVVNGAKLAGETQIVVRAFEYEGSRIRTLHIGDTAIGRTELEMEGTATKDVHYTIKGETKIYLEFESNPNQITLTWEQPDVKEGTLKVLKAEDNTELSSGASIPSGTRVKVVATPTAAYKVLHIVIGELFITGSNLLAGEGEAKYAEATISSDTNIRAEFEALVAPSYPISFTAPTEVASLVTITRNGETIQSGAEAKMGDQIKFVFKGHENYVVNFWRVNGYTEAMGSNELVKTMPNEKLNVELVVKEAKRYTVTFNDNPQGGVLTATIDGVAIQSGEKVLSGKKILFTAIPSQGFEIKKWLHNGEMVNGVKETYQVILGGDISVEVVFAQKNAIDTPHSNATRVVYNEAEEAWEVLNAEGRWRLIAITGATVAEGYGSQVEASSLAKGVYFLVINNASYKLIKP